MSMHAVRAVGLLNGYWLGFPARRRHLKQGTAVIWPEYDYALVAPCSAGHPSCVAEYLRIATRNIRFLKFPHRAERDRPAVGRPKGFYGIIGPRQELCIVRIEIANIQHAFPVGRKGCEGHLLSVRRDNRKIILLVVKRKTLRRCKRKPNRTFRC